MQQLLTLTRTVPPHVTMQILIDRHGAWGAFRAFLRALPGRRNRRLALADLSDHLRRDIGLAERGEPPPAFRGLWM
ncbi:MAG: hypothetical protein KDK10_00455 [Maritimibacter sp.]|nr:hypothetical protein [Maritimibacter sp.]